MSQLATASTIQKRHPLEDAFLAFNEISEHLTDSYQQLEQQVSVLGDELARSNSENIQYLSDKEALAAQLEGLIEAIPGAVIVLNEAQQVIKANACARSWLGSDVVGLQWSVVREQKLVQDEASGDQLKLDSGQIIALSIRELVGQSGQIVLLSDITQQQALYQQLEHKKKLAEMGEFSASLAHQIRTPLASALLYASQLNTDSLTGAAKTKFATKLLGRLRLLNSQVTDMLSYSHSGEFSKAPMALTSFSNAIKDLYAEKRVDIDSSLNNGFAESQLYISKDALIGSISNLIDNALDATSDETTVSCSIELSGVKELKVTVKDKGVGLTQAQQQRIFEPFYTNKPNGTGLGLAVVNDVVSAHGGEIKCLSEVSVGTSMVITLPVVMQTSTKQTVRSV